MNPIEQIQTILGVTADGQFGPVSYGALQAAIRGNPAMVEQVQGVLGVAEDGVWGPQSITAFNSLVWPYTVAVAGNDLEMAGVATCWGGPTDPDDDGTTACGFSTLNNPQVKAVSLAMRASTVAALMGSPVPHMPFGLIQRGGQWVDNPEGAHVIVTVNGTDHGPWPVIDEGPGFNPPDFKPRVVDITTVGALEIDPAASANNFEVPCSVRILGGAQWLPA